MPNTLDGTGLTIKTLEELLEDIQTDQRALIDPDIDVSDETPLGQLNGIFAGHLAEVLELVQEVYNGQIPANAVKATLDGISAITGTRRLYAAPTRVQATINVDGGFIADPGDLIAHISGDPSKRFTNSESVLNPNAVAANVSVEFVAEENGPTSVGAGTLVVIAEPVTGWNSITNPLQEKSLGRFTETDEALRTRRERDLAAGGDTTVDAIRTEIVATVEGILEIEVVENDEEVTDANGIPAKSFEVLVRGGDDTEIAEVILAKKPVGIRAFGTTEVTVQDAQGNDHVIGFSRPDAVEVHVEASLEIFPNQFEGVTAARQAIADWYEANAVQGLDVVRSRISAICMGLPGVKRVIFAHTGLTALTTDVDQTINHRQIADVNVVNVSVLTTDATEP